MKFLSVLGLLSLMITNSFSSDFITLNNQMRFEGKVTKIKDCHVSFKADGNRFEIPFEDIYSVQFEDLNNPLYLSYISIPQVNNDACMLGRLDADNLHGKGGGHVLLGFLFGPFAVVGAAVANPLPDRGKKTYALSQNQHLLTDPIYINCYKKKAKGKNVGGTFIGWGLSILLLLGISG